jgi:hypothetical protein
MVARKISAFPWHNHCVINLRGKSFMACGEGSVANTNEIEYPAEATVGDQWLRDASGQPQSDVTKPWRADLRRRIAQVAYEFYLRRGKGHGHDLDDWLAAETAVLSRSMRSEKHRGEQVDGEETQ